MGQTTTTSLNDVFALSLVGFIMMLLLALAVVLFYIMYQRKLLGQQLEVSAMRERERQRVLTAIVTSQEDERRRIAAELHDSVGMLLTTSQLFMRQIEPGSKHLKHHQSALSLMDDTLRNLREITNNLAPENLIRFGLLAALEDLAGKVAMVPDLTVNLEVDISISDTTERQAMLYRIVQELFANTIKHASSQRIDLKVSLTPCLKRLHYRDDGRGMDLDAVLSKGHHHGLGNLINRAEILGNVPVIESAPDQGFSFDLVLP